jgi:hypothetical protein
MRIGVHADATFNIDGVWARTTLKLKTFTAYLVECYLFWLAAVFRLACRSPADTNSFVRQFLQQQFLLWKDGRLNFDLVFVHYTARPAERHGDEMTNSCGKEPQLKQGFSRFCMTGQKNCE